MMEYYLMYATDMDKDFSLLNLCVYFDDFLNIKRERGWGATLSITITDVWIVKMMSS